MYLREARDNLRQLHHGPMGFDRDAQHLAQHRDPDLKANAGEEAGQHGLREEVGNEAQFEQSRNGEESGSHQGHQARQRDIPCAAGVFHAGDASGENRRGRRIGGHHEVAGRTESRETQQQAAAACRNP